MRRARLVVVGDALLDREISGTVSRVAPDAPAPVLDVTTRRQNPGGAGLAALLAAHDGSAVTLAAPLARDEDGRWLERALRQHVDLVAFGHQGPTRRKTRLRSGTHTLARVDDGGPGTPLQVPTATLRARLADADAVLVADYGGGTTLDPAVRAVLEEVTTRIPVVWDPHPRGGRPVSGALLATPNVAEARGALDDDGPPDRRAARLREAWHARGVVVTAGSAGAFFADGGSPRFLPSPQHSDGDTCGAGDRFAVTVALALADGALPWEAAADAVAAASRWVAAGGADAFLHRLDRGSAYGGPADDTLALESLAAQLRTGGRVLVATGGCFDVLHTGHVATLEAARRLGDALVVLLNSDASVRALKGPGRPVVAASDRARVLRALGCVDAVVEFDDPDPRATIARLRPDVWVKGGDYAGATMLEEEVVEAGGGRVVLLPYVDGHSTSSILDRARSGPEPVREAV